MRTQKNAFIPIDFIIILFCFKKQQSFGSTDGSGEFGPDLDNFYDYPVHLHLHIL